jgi:hypothetical protein
LNRDELQPFQLEAIEEFFDGDRSFYTVFLNSCIDQFAQDLAEADAACAQDDAATLRRVAHSLKSVLRTLGLRPTRCWPKSWSRPHNTVPGTRRRPNGSCCANAW